MMTTMRLQLHAEMKLESCFAARSSKKPKRIEGPVIFQKHARTVASSENRSFILPLLVYFYLKNI
jgi:hypothetical protein